MTWETWIKALKPGDPVWHIHGHKGVLADFGPNGVMVDTATGLQLWDYEDCTQPETTLFHIWAAAQPQGDDPDHWEMT